jgi:hypothetical protein
MAYVTDKTTARGAARCGTAEERLCKADSHGTIGRSIATLLLLRSLSLRSPSGEPLTVRMPESLLALPALTELAFHAPLRNDIVEIIRRYRNVKKLECDYFAIEYLNMLVDGDAPVPPLDSLCLGWTTVGTTSAVRLVKLAPTLTELDARLSLLSCKCGRAVPRPNDEDHHTHTQGGGRAS